MSANWLEETIKPKSDQINADDLLTGPLTVTVVGFKKGTAEQPIDILLAEAKPYRPCKSMRRVLVQLWGNDPAEWTGRRMTLYADPSIMFGGLKVGGIRISHMSDISPKGAELLLTSTRSKRSAFVVQCLSKPAEKPQTNADPRAADIALVIAAIKKHYEAAEERKTIYASWQVTDPRKPDQWTDDTLAKAVEFAKSLD